MELPKVPTDSFGRITHGHVAKCHVGNGEMTLCGMYIDYKTYKGIVASPPPCIDCEERDC